MGEVAKTCELCGEGPARRLRLQVFPWFYKCIDLCETCGADVREYTLQVREAYLRKS